MRIALNNRWGWWAALLALCAVLVAPLLLVDVPPLLDYPNHLARMVLLAYGPTDPILSRFAVTHWAVIPDLALDLVLPPLLHILPVHVAGRIVVGTILLLPVLGGIAYSRALFGTQSWWALAAGLSAYNGTLMLGFLNFIASVGLAFLFAAVWLSGRESHPARTTLLTALGAIVLFFCHLAGLMCLVVLLLAHELARLLPLLRDRVPVVRPAARSGVLLLCVFAPAAVLYATSALQHAGGPILFPGPGMKLAQLLVPFTNYIRWLDIATAVTVAAFLAACAFTHRCRIPPSAGIALAAFAVLYAVAPYAAKGTQHIDVRFAVMLGFMLFAGISPVRLPRRAVIAAAVGFVALFGVRMTVLAAAWHGTAIDLAAMRGVIAAVPPGSSVFVAAVSPQEAPEYWRHAPMWRQLSDGQRTDAHMPALLLIERHAFWPFLFDNQSQQPIRLRSHYRALAMQAAAIPDHHVLADPGAVDLCGFDQLLLLDAGGEPHLAHFATDRLTLLARSDFVALFRVLPQPRRCGGT